MRKSLRSLLYGRSGIRHVRWVELRRGDRRERNLGVDVNGEATSGRNHEGDSTNATPRGGLPRTSDEAE